MSDKISVSSSHPEDEGGNRGGNKHTASSHLAGSLLNTGLPDVSAIEVKQSNEVQGWELNLVTGITYLAPIEVASLLSITKRAVNKNAAIGLFPGSKKITENGVEVWRIPFTSLPSEAQTRYLLENAPRRTPEEEKAHILKLNAKIIADAQTDGEAGQPVPRTKLLPVPILERSHQEALWLRWEQASEKEQAKAERALLRMQAWERHLQAGMVAKSAIEAAIRAEFGSVETSHATLWRYRQRIEGQPSEIWLPLLLPEYQGGALAIEIEANAWEWFVSEWAIQSKPPISVVYRRYKQEAAKRGWTVPSVDWFEDRTKTIAIPVLTYLREGDRALQEALPPIIRDYEKLPIHSIWCSDFRRLDLWCVIDGEVCQPHMIAWQELRTRKILAWRLVKNPNPDAVRLCFRDAMLASEAMPVNIYVDNGMEYAAKCNTGGATRRNRFKKRDDEVWGLFTLLNVNIIWSTPGYAWSKPIESFWAGFKQGLENRREFEGAYKGASPDQRPENAAPNKEKAAAVAVQEARINALIGEEIAAFHNRGHRGHGMKSRSPNDVWAELRAVPDLLQRSPTGTQLRLCLVRMEAVKLDRYGQFTLQGSKYGSERLATERLPNMTYTVLFDPDNLARPVSVLLNGEFYCEASPIGVVQFGDTEAVREHSKQKTRHRKAIKAAASALVGMETAKGRTVNPDSGATEVLPPSDPLPALSQDTAELPIIPPQEKAVDPTAPDEELLAEYRAWRESESKKRHESIYLQD